mgnify:CR=1 FL=1
MKLRARRICTRHQLLKVPGQFSGENSDSLINYTTRIKAIQNRNPPPPGFGKDGSQCSLRRGSVDLEMFLHERLDCLVDRLLKAEPRSAVLILEGKSSLRIILDIPGHDTLGAGATFRYPGVGSPEFFDVIDDIDTPRRLHDPRLLCIGVDRETVAAERRSQRPPIGPGVEHEHSFQSRINSVSVMQTTTQREIVKTADFY